MSSPQAATQAELRRERGAVAVAAVELSSLRRHSEEAAQQLAAKLAAAEGALAAAETREAALRAAQGLKASASHPTLATGLALELPAEWAAGPTACLSPAMPRCRENPLWDTPPPGVALGATAPCGVCPVHHDYSRFQV